MFYEQLQKICKLKGTTITSVLKKIKVGTANGTYWKNGSMPSADILIKLSEFLNVTTDFLLTGKESASNHLSEDQEELLHLFDKLPEKEQHKLIGRLENMTETNKPQLIRMPIAARGGIDDDHFLTQEELEKANKKHPEIKENKLPEF